MEVFHKAKQYILLYFLIAGLMCFSTVSIAKPLLKKTSSNQSAKNVLSSATSLTPIKQNYIMQNNVKIFESTLFKDLQNRHPSLIWLYESQIPERRNQIAAIHRMVLEKWWMMELESFYLADRSTNQIIIRPKINTVLLARLYPFLFARVEFELLTGSGSVQEIFKRVGEFNGVRHREIFFLWTASQKMAIQFGAINQKFLNAPLLMANNPFLSLIESINLIDNETSDMSLKIQQSIPNTFSASNPTHTQKLKTPLFTTFSYFHNYHPQSFYKIKTSTTLFHFHSLPTDIAGASILYGNTPAKGDIAEFKYHYAGFYTAWEPSIRLFPTMELRFKMHYIQNLRVSEKNHNKGLLYGLQLLYDFTQNIRITPGLEYFINQPDSAVAYYNSEGYGHNDRKGFAGTITVNLYDRNIEFGLRYMNTQSVRTAALINNQDSFSIFFRMNYEKI